MLDFDEYGYDKMLTVSFLRQDSWFEFMLWNNIRMAFVLNIAEDSIKVSFVK